VGRVLGRSSAPLAELTHAWCEFGRSALTDPRLEHCRLVARRFHRGHDEAPRPTSDEALQGWQWGSGSPGAPA